MLTRLLANPIYVRVRKNQFRVRSLESAKEATFDAPTPFTTARLLIGQFLVAERVEASGEGNIEGRNLRRVTAGTYSAARNARGRTVRGRRARVAGSRNGCRRVKGCGVGWP